MLKKRSEKTKSIRRLAIQMIIASSVSSIAACGMGGQAFAGEVELVDVTLSDCCPPVEQTIPFCPPIESDSAYAPSYPSNGSVEVQPAEAAPALSPNQSPSTAVESPSSEPFDPALQSSPSNQPASVDSFAQSASSLASTSGSSGRLNAPNMIGDTSAGGCGGLTISGDLAASINHPIYACSRLNIAENNSAVARNRGYVSYRHFHNAAELSFFPDDPEGRAASFDTDVFTLGYERLLTRNTSIEFRLPITTQLTSDLFISDQGGGVSNLDAIFADGRETSIGNIGIVLKTMLVRSAKTTFTAGFGLNIPTAPDLRLRFDVDRTFNTPTGATGFDIDADGTYKNETVNFQPFLAFLRNPNERFFYQGFLQFDIPLNQSRGSLDLTVDENPIALPTVDLVNAENRTGDLGLQSLVRVNLGAGMHLGQFGAIRCNPVRHALLTELHYTGTLDGPDRLDFPIDRTPADPNADEDIIVNIGPLAESTNSLNAVLGLASFVGKTSVYNGFTAPLRDGTDRGFDFEYSLLLNRTF